MENINGLTNEEVKIRINKGLVNYDTTAPSKSIKQIFIENSFTLFNLINIILAALIVMVGSYKNLLFLGVVICNTLISTIQEVRAKKIVDKLSVISSSKVKVIRDKKEVILNINEIVLDDVIKYELGNQVVVDSIILDGECEVNESFITGEAKTITKRVGDTLLSGSFIVSGNVLSKVIHIGLDNYTSVISRDAKIMTSEKKSEIMKALNKIVKYISICLIPIGILLLLNQFSIEKVTTESAVVSVVAALIGMIPEGLILLVSTVLAVSTLRLSNKNVLVQELNSIETLARVDTICLDKTGTITEGNMFVYDVIPVNKHSMNEIDEVMEIISTNLNDNTPTFKAVKDKYNNKSFVKAKKVINFSSERKYSAVLLKDCSYYIGAIEYMLDDISKYKKKIDELSTDNRVLTLIKSVGDKDIKQNDNEVLAFILIRDKIRKEAFDIIKFLNENDVNVKVISGDNAKTVSTIAKEVGININGIYDMSLFDKESNINTIAEENNIFIRVKPDQKRLLISALKNNGHVVAMTGDGVNHVLALKESDCGIALASGTDAARNVSEFVLLDSNFNSIPEIIKEGRRTINNVERSATLFLSKTIYATLLAIAFMFINYKYPFEPIQMTLINALTIGIPAFILALEPNTNRIKKGFFINVISKSIPSGITTVINIIILCILSSLFKLNNMQTSTIAVIITAYTALLLIYRISKPLNKLRKTLLTLIVISFVTVLLTSIGRSIFSLSILNPTSILILLLCMLLTTKLFNLFSKLLNILIIRKSKWFI